MPQVSKILSNCNIVITHMYLLNRFSYFLKKWFFWIQSFLENYSSVGKNWNFSPSTPHRTSSYFGTSLLNRAVKCSSQICSENLLDNAKSLTFLKILHSYTCMQKCRWINSDIIIYVWLKYFIWKCSCSLSCICSGVLSSTCLHTKYQDNSQTYWEYILN